MGKRKLVVIGNGMAGARAVEEVLARGGADMFDITMFGDEPYGNYNRILLSNVLNGSQDPAEIFMNPLDWYAENGITLHAARRSPTSTAPPRRCAPPHGVHVPLRRPADRDGQPRLHPADRGHDGTPTASCAPASSPSARSTTATASSPTRRRARRPP